MLVRYLLKISSFHFKSRILLSVCQEDYSMDLDDTLDDFGFRVDQVKYKLISEGACVKGGLSSR